MSISRLAYLLALIGGIVMAVFGVLALLQDTFRAAFFGWGFFKGGLVTLIAGIVAIIGANRVSSLVWSIVFIVVGLIGGGLGGLLVVIGGVLGLFPRVAKEPTKWEWSERKSHNRSGSSRLSYGVLGVFADKGDLHQAKMLHNGIAGSQLMVMDKADHALIWAHTEEFERVVEEFLNN